MGRKQVELGAMAVSQIRRRGMNFVGGVAGLGLNVTKSGSRNWILRYQVGGVRRDKGLGGYPDVTLAQAREAARSDRAKIVQGVDPIDDGRSARARLVASRSTALTFAEAAKQYIDAHEAGWRSAKHAQQWRNTIETYASPVVGKVLVRDVSEQHILAILKPIWRGKTETASRLRGRMECVLDWAIAHRYREGANPARWKGLLDNMLPPPEKIAKQEHHAALHYDELPAFMVSLRGHEGIGARALEFTILTAARSGETRGARWDEFDLECGVWTIPGERMKASKPHRVPLSLQALALVQGQRERSVCDYVFPSPLRGSPHYVRDVRSSGTGATLACPPYAIDSLAETRGASPARVEYSGAPLSDMTLSAVLRRMKVPAVPHGFRSTFRDWAAEKTDHPREVAEMALAHTIGNKVEAAYRRGDLMEKRRQLMQAWGDYADSSRVRS